MTDTEGIVLTVGGLGLTLVGLFLILGTGGMPELYGSSFPWLTRVGLALLLVGAGAVVTAGVAW